MLTNNEWRGFDVSKKHAKIEKAVNLMPLRSAEDFPIIINAPCYFGFGDRSRTAEYFCDPAIMVKFQEDGYYKHLSRVHDDTVPYFMPWFGTGIVASAFGCPMREAAGHGDDPAVIGGCIEDLKDIARLKIPDPYKDGWMPRVIDTIDYARTHSDLPVGLTDMNSPLSTAAQMCGYDKLFIWMFEEPEAVHELMDKITDAFIQWVKVQKAHIGEPLDASNGLQGIWAPKGVGVWVSDDDIVSMSPDLYEEFVVPRYSRIFETFGGGSVHFCGNAAHQAENLLRIKNMRIINNSTLYDFDAFEKLYRKVSGKVALQIQDVAYEDIDHYITHLFDRMDNLNGVMIASFIIDGYAMVEGGKGKYIERDAIEASKTVVSSVRRYLDKRLRDEEA
jgi:hypothetical protein